MHYVNICKGKRGYEGVYIIKKKVIRKVKGMPQSQAFTSRRRANRQSQTRANRTNVR